MLQTYFQKPLCSVVILCRVTEPVEITVCSDGPVSMGMCDDGISESW